jgi:acetyl esterase/lipase
MIDFRVRPAKEIYLLFQAIVTLTVRLPLWVLVSAIPSLRPNPRWSFGRALRVRLQNRVAVIDSVYVRPSGDLALANILHSVQGLDNHPTYRRVAPAHIDKVIWVDPVPELVVGEVKAWAQAAEVDSVQIPMYVYHRPGADPADSTPLSAGEKVALSLHGGGYIVRSASPDDPSAGAMQGLLAGIPTLRRAYNPDYRLSTTVPGAPANPFPAALLDALAAYHHLLTAAGIRAADIVLVGNSAGGNLALALVRYLLEHRGTLALDPPGGVVLFAPWADPGTSHARPRPAYFHRTDWIGNDDGPSVMYGQVAFAGAHGTAFLDTTAYVSPGSKILPARASFAGWPRTFMVCGSSEWFSPQIRTLRDFMAADMGEGTGEGQLYYYEEPDAVHNFVGLAWHEPERSRMLKKLAGWLKA